VLFLNNAINHGVLDSLGVPQAAAHGKSDPVHAGVEPRTGPRHPAGLLVLRPRMLRPSVPGAIIIHFSAGSTRSTFPYVLMKPRLILAAMAGGASAIAWFTLTNAGLVASPSPGSIFAYAAETPRGGYFIVFTGVLIGAGVSFAVASVLLGFGRGRRPSPPTTTRSEPAAEPGTPAVATGEA